MTEELKDKLDARESDEQYPEYAGKKVPDGDMAQAESLGDSVLLEKEWPRK